MNGAQDMGGQMGFGPVVAESTSRRFTPSGRSGRWR